MARSKLPSWLIFLLVALVATTAFLWGRKSAPPAPRPALVAGADDGQRLAAMEHELQGLRAATMRATLTSQQAMAVRANEASNQERVADSPAAEGRDPDPAPEVDPAQQEREVLAARVQHFDGLNHRLETEPVDVAWSRTNESAFKQLVPQTMGPQIAIAEATCGSTLCRLKLNHPDLPRIPQEKVFQFMANRGPLEGMAVQFDSRTPGTTTLFFLREQAP